jgi:hypothetical protein
MREIRKRFGDDETRRIIWELLTVYDKSHSFTSQLHSVFLQLETLTGWVSIKSPFYRDIERRYHARHFWPEAVSGKLNSMEPLDWVERLQGVDHQIVVKTSQRGRWFGAQALDGESVLDLTGFDVGSSQTQILAVLLGITELEERASSEKSFKRYLAEHAWTKHCDPNDPFTLHEGYAGADDTLTALVKDLWMRALYGSPVARVVRDQQDALGEFGPGWTFQNADRFLRSLPWFQKVERFLQACRRLAVVAHKTNETRGVVFTDPYDGTEVRWNPVARVDEPLSSNGLKIIVSLPATPPDGLTGDHSVDRDTLKKNIAPGIVHVLDAFFAALVIERLHSRGVRDFVSIHDCWYVPTPRNEWRAAKVLKECIRSAGEPWLKGLGPIYDLLESHLRTDAEFGDDVQRWRAHWQARIYRQHWPKFAISEVEPYAIEARPASVGHF